MSVNVLQNGYEKVKKEDFEEELEYDLENAKDDIVMHVLMVDVALESNQEGSEDVGPSDLLLSRVWLLEHC